MASDFCWSRGAQPIYHISLFHHATLRWYTIVLIVLCPSRWIKKGNMVHNGYFTSKHCLGNKIGTGEGYDFISAIKLL